MADLNEVGNFQDRNIFKALEFAVFAKIAEDGDEEITHVYDGTGVVVPDGYEPVGFTTKDDGATWTRATENSDEMAHGFAQPVRRDITSDVLGLSFTAMEAKRLVLEMAWAQDIDAQATESGIYWDKANRPSPRRLRLLGIAKDSSKGDPVYCGRWLTSAQLDEGADQQWSDDAAATYPLTFTGFYDSEFGTAMREMWGGPGFDAVDRGFAAPPVGP